MPLWLKVWYRTPFLDRGAYVWMWHHGYWWVPPALDWSDDDSVGSGSPYVLSPNVEIRTGSVNQPSEGRPMTEDLALGAFPQAMRSDVIEAIAIVPMPTVRSSELIGDVIVSGEPVLIPSRTYSAEPAEESVENLGTEARLVLACWYSRHYSGFVREQATRRIVDVERQWVAPFVVQLLGEYVIEIAEVIEEAVEGLSPKLYQDFARENPSFLQLTRQRVVSYWVTFYRSRCSFSDYPPFKVMHRLGIWQGLEGRRLLDRDDS